MRTKILFFLLGAVVATLAYMVGSINANDQATKVDWLHVSEGIIIGNNKLEVGSRVMIVPDRILVAGKNNTTTLITQDRVSIEGKEVKSLIGVGKENAVLLLSHDGKKQHVGVQLKPEPQVVINNAGQVKRMK